MRTKKTTPTMTMLLRKALAEGGTFYGIEKATGVLRQSLMAFRDGKTIRLDNADRLAKYFGIECRVTRRQARTGTKGKG
jgi:hypothetical protein